MVENNNPRQSTGNRRVSRRSALKGLTTIAGLASVAGCVSGGGSGNGSGGGGSIKIGLQADLTGALAIYGFWHRRVLENYVEQLNSNGGIGGRNVELLVKDTETDPQVGARVFRNLVQQNQVDFVIGSQSSGVSIATTPLAKQFKVPYFPLGEAPSITGEDGNRWVLRNNHSTGHAAEIAVQYGMNDIGSKWTIIYQNYSFGKQYRNVVQKGVKRRGGEVLKSIGVPLGESDLIPYLNKVPDGTDVLFNALIGSSAVNFLQQSSNLNTPGSRLGAIASIEGVDIQGLSKEANGAEYVTMLPRRPSETEGDLAEYLKQMANASETDNVYLGGHIAASYEALSWIGDGVVASEWSGDDDDQAFIKWFERGPSVEASKKYPQGQMFFRGTDHQGFMDMFIEKIDNNQLNKVKQFIIDEPTFEPRADLESQEF